MSRVLVIECISERPKSMEIGKDWGQASTAHQPTRKMIVFAPENQGNLAISVRIVKEDREDASVRVRARKG